MRSSFISFCNQIPKCNRNIGCEQLFEMCKHSVSKNIDGLMIFSSDITARSALFTTIVDNDNREDSTRFVIDKFYCVDPKNCLLFQLKSGPYTATVVISKSVAHLGLMLRKNFEIVQTPFVVANSDVMCIDIPEWEIDKEKRFVYVDPRDRITLIGGIDYYGELKMSVLRMTMEITRTDRGGLGVHAGSKVCAVKIFNGKIVEKGGLIFGLSGTGKTTLTCYTHPSFNKDEGEFTTVLQDDVNYLLEDGTVLGSEKGFYVKCDNCPEHTEITKAVFAPGSVLENVSVKDNRIDWKDFSHTSNTRAIVKRLDLPSTNDTIDTHNLKFIVFNTRRPELPPICKLVSPQQAAAYYALGESIITSAESDEDAGKSKRQLGFDPFIIRNEKLNVERMCDILQRLMEKDKSFEVYLVNTGYVGSPDNDITVQTTVKYLEEALRENIVWGYNVDLRCSTPVTLEREFNPEKYYGVDYPHIIQNLRNERVNYLTQYNISEEIIKSI